MVVSETVEVSGGPEALMWCGIILPFYCVFHYYANKYLLSSHAELWMEEKYGNGNVTPTVPNDGSSNFADAAMFMNVTNED